MQLGIPNFFSNFVEVSWNFDGIFVNFCIFFKNYSWNFRGASAGYLYIFRENSSWKCRKFFKKSFTEVSRKIYKNFTKITDEICWKSKEIKKKFHLNSAEVSAEISVEYPWNFTNFRIFVKKFRLNFRGVSEKIPVGNSEFILNFTEVPPKVQFKIPRKLQLNIPLHFNRIFLNFRFFLKNST